MARRDLARERLQTIRSLQGWREAYKVAGLDTQGDSNFSDSRKNATKRRRLSRLINRKTTGAKKLDAKQRRSINRTVKTKRRRKAFDKARTDKQVKALNKVRANARRKANATFGPGGTFPDPKKLKVRLDANKPLTKEDKERIAKAFETADKDSGRAIRKEYKTLLARVKITNLPQNQRAEHSRKLLKATKAVDRDEIKEKKTKQIKLIKPKKKRKDVDIMEWYKGWR
jgi:hypothetical protein